jgi:hypothetical protein
MVPRPGRCRENSACLAYCSLVLLSFAAALAGFSGAAAAETRRVVLLHSFGRDFKPWGEYARAIRAELERQSPWPLEISDHSLMTARFSGENPEGPFVEYLRALFAAQRPDLIVSIGAPAAGFVQRNRQQVFGTIPMLFTAVEQRRIRFTELTPHDTVVAVAHDFPAAIENILRLLPDTQSVLVVNGNSPLEQFWQEEMRREFRPFEDRLAFKWVNHLSFQGILEQASSLPPRSAIFWHLMSVDAAGIAHEGGAALSRLRDVATAPIFSYDDSFFGRDLVGGPMHSVPKVVTRRRPPRCAFFAERVPAISRHRQRDSRRRNSTGESCSAGASVKAAFPREAMCIFASRARGSVTAGNSPASSWRSSCSHP